MGGPWLARLVELRWLALGASLLLGLVLLRTQVVDTVSVESDSMEPSICAGDRLVVSKLGLHESLEPGELVVFRSPEDGTRVVKRVVALEGQRVAVRDGALYVDRRRQVEPYVDLATMDGAFFGPVVVAPETVFVLGDHREVSIDSRDYGGVPRDSVEGTVLATLWSSCSV